MTDSVRNAVAWVDPVPPPRGDGTIQTSSSLVKPEPCLNLTINETLSIWMIKRFRVTPPEWVSTHHQAIYRIS